jgi:MoaA/NifB/PqqE/SkfB family radical SAM enzyme
MRIYEQRWNRGALRDALDNASRRYDWFLGNATHRQLWNAMSAAAHFAMGTRLASEAPVLLKVDISPACNLKCTYCVHALPSGDAAPILAAQSFHAGQRMSVEEFSALVREVAGVSAATSLYYVGDPLTHPDLDALCNEAARAGLRVHISTNFSFALSDERLRSLAESGMTHLTACIESLDQASYELTRVGGNISRVLDNLARLSSLRSRRRLKIEVQMIKFRHNEHEVARVADWCERHGVDQFTTYWGNLHNYADMAPDRVVVGSPRRRRLIPRCAWPYFAMQIRYDGQVIPCCYHRVSEQYRDGGDARTVGNVFDRGVRSVWRSEAYAALRRLVSNPAGMGPTEAANSFCHGCHVAFHTDGPRNAITGDQTAWEAVYTRDSRGRVVRRLPVISAPTSMVSSQGRDQGEISRV